MPAQGQLSVLVVLVTVACSGQQEAIPNQADIDEVTRLNHAWVAAVKTNISDSINAYFTDDVVLLPPNEPAISGAAAVSAWGQQLSEQITFTEARAEIDEVGVGGQWAFVRGTFHGTVQPKAGGPAITEASKYVLIFRRQPGGSWKIARDIWNSSAPAPTGS